MEPGVDTKRPVWYTPQMDPDTTLGLHVHLPPLTGREPECILKYRTWVLNQRLILSPMGIAQRAQVELTELLSGAK